MMVKNKLKEKKEALMDSMLDVQKQKIDALLNVVGSRNDDIDRLCKKVSRLNTIIRKKNKIISDKDAVLFDVAEELRISKEREEELISSVKDYLKEIESLKKKLADKVVDKIDAQALKSAENALAEKDKVISSLSKGIKRLYKIVDGDPILNVKEMERATKQSYPYFDDFMQIVGIW